MLKQYNEIDVNQTEQTQKLKKYELIQECKIKQNQWCGAIAISSDNHIVIIGCKNKLRIYQFQQQMLKLLQTYKSHTLDVNTINFFKKPSQMITGSEDKQIILWSLINGNSKKYINKQKGKDGQILSLILNEKEEQIISGSSIIQIWKLQNGWSCIQTITDHKDFVWALNINENGNQLLSSGYDKLVIIYKLIKDNSQNSKWILIQKIEGDGFRLCWINDSLFTFQFYCKEYLSLYQKYETNQIFRKTKNIYINNNSTQCYGFFPQNFIKKKNILVNKNGRNVNILSKQENDNFILDQSIQFNDYQIQGCLSDDGEFLITWDGGKKGSFEIQIRKYQEL
ncbi:unnamed protein product [Paramecium primaurelia]|uniref:WD40-repeat-containing domain n=1 Tax=Paramecium primaurelia TaxID=5886 RepID=A0A8S1MBC7_PARPR|nr:unnamed protein product [Paramecium primaurelia]